MKDARLRFTIKQQEMLSRTMDVTQRMPTHHSHISINGKRLELHAGTRIDRNYLFQNR